MLTRSEELVLLAVYKLNEQAYGIPIQELIKDWTQKDWAIGAIYKPLKQLYQKRMVTKEISKPTAERGGRSKYIYKITSRGEEALKEIRRIQDLAWNETMGS